MSTEDPNKNIQIINVSPTHLVVGVSIPSLLIRYLGVELNCSHQSGDTSSLSPFNGQQKNPFQLSGELVTGVCWA